MRPPNDCNLHVQQLQNNYQQQSHDIIILICVLVADVYCTCDYYYNIRENKYKKKSIVFSAHKHYNVKVRVYVIGLDKYTHAIYIKYM